MLGSRQSYFIHDGYRIRGDALFFDDTPYKDEFQRPVYEYARQIADERGYKKILDLGCGSGFKLLKYFSDFHTVGVDLEPTVKWLRKTGFVLNNVLL
jgi:SAM-dependent methyltransferase